MNARATFTPLEIPATNLLATVDHLLRQLELRDGQLAPDQIAMLRQSADRARSSLRAIRSY